MNIRQTLRPGQRGTKRLRAEYGDRLVCVRYRCDAARQKRLTTVELIVDETDWMPPQPARHAPETVVGVRVDVKEREVQRTVKAAGGKWNAAKTVWELPYRQVVKLGLRDRIAPDGMESL